IEHPEYRQSYERVLDGLAKTRSSDPFALSELARRNIRENTPESLGRAIMHLSQAVRSGYAESADYEMLANLLATAGKTEGAIDVLKRGIELNPYPLRLYKTLVMKYISAKEYDNALETMKRSLDVFPEDSLMRSLLARVQGSP